MTIFSDYLRQLKDVEKQAPLVKGQAYQIADATGKIWVVTNQSNLKVGRNVRILSNLTDLQQFGW